MGVDCIDRSYVSGLNDQEGQGDGTALHPGSVVVSGLLEYLWANWDDHMDVCVNLWFCLC